MKKEKNKLNEIVLIRVFTILSVVLGHSMIVYSSLWTAYDMRVPSPFFNNLKDVINIYQMPLFIFVSGYLFYFLRIEKEKYAKFSDFFVGKAKRLLIPFAVVGVFYMIPLRLLGHYSGYTGKSMFRLIAIDLFLGVDSGNLWFLPCLFAIFILFYFFTKYAKVATIQFYFFVMMYIVANASVFMPNVLFIKNILYYSLFFFLGYYVRFLLHVQLSKRSIKLVFGISFLFQFVPLVIKFPTHTLTGKLLQFNFVLLSSIASCLFFYLLFSFISDRISLSENSFILKIDKYSYGIYLFHSALIYPVLDRFQTIEVNPFVFVTALFAFIFTVSLAMTVLLSKIRYLKFIIGS